MNTSLVQPNLHKPHIFGDFLAGFRMLLMVYGQDVGVQWFLFGIKQII